MIALVRQAIGEVYIYTHFNVRAVVMLNEL